MKPFIGFLMPFLCALSSFGQNLNEKDSIAIISVIDDWDNAWKSKNHVLASRAYSKDARFVNAFGDKCYGQAEVDKLLQEVFQLPFVMAGNSETIGHRFQVLYGTTIVVHTSVLRKGQQMPDNTLLPDRRTTHMRVLQKTKANWKIVAHLISDARDKNVPSH